MATNYPSSNQSFTDASSGDTITSSNHNTIQDTIEALETKLGLASIAKAATAGHFAMPHTTDGGPPTGNPANGEGSMVWDATNNKLYVATADSATWAEVGGGGGTDFTTPVNVDIDEDNYALDLTNPSEAKMIRMGGGVTMSYGGGIFTTSLVNGGGFIKSYIPAGYGAVAQEIGLYYNAGFKLSSGVDFTVVGGVSSLTANDATDPALLVNQQDTGGTILDLEKNGTSAFTFENVSASAAMATFEGGGGGGGGSQTRVLNLKGGLAGAYGWSMLNLDYAAAAPHRYGIALAKDGTAEVWLHAAGGNMGADESSPSFNIDAKVTAAHGSNAQGGFRFTQTVNKAGGDYSAWIVDITDTASGGELYLADLKIGGTSKYTVNENGIVNYNGTMGNSSKDPTSDAPADWVQVAIGGSTYYLPAYAAS